MVSKMFQFVFTLLVLKIIDVEGKGQLAVKFVEFHNKDGLDINGQCCDGVNIPTCPLEKCDHHFTICTGDQPAMNFTDDSCIYGREDFNAPDNENDLYFTAGGKSSLFSFDKWKGWASISVLVTDSDNDGLVPVDNLFLNFTSLIPGFNSTTDYKSTHTLLGNRAKYPTRLLMKVKVYCDPHYYGDDCSVNCVSDNACDGHYTCDNKGRKVCNSGWKGDNCDSTVPGGVADCSVYQDRTEFVPSLWEGQYQCPGEASQNFVLNVTRSTGNIDVVADMTIQSFVISLTGTYASSFKIMTLQVQTLVPQEIGERNLTKLELNLQETKPIEMTGNMFINYERCSILRLIRMQAYFGGCNMQGTCVRYGGQKDQFYCCCNDGTQGTSCSQTTKSYKTTPTSKPTTPTTTPTTTPINTPLYNDADAILDTPSVNIPVVKSTPRIFHSKTEDKKRHRRFESCEYSVNYDDDLKIHDLGP